MNFELKLALHNARARRKSLARFTSLVAIVGIAAGVASLIIAQSLARGFADEMRDKILANTAHITVFSNEEGAKIPNWRAAKHSIENTENVRAVEPTTYANALIAGKEATSYAILRVKKEVGNPRVGKGVSSNAESKTEEQMPNDENRPDIPHLKIGARLAEKLNLSVGDQAEIITLESGSAPQRTGARVGGIFRTGLYDYDSSWIYISPEDFARLENEREFTPTVLSVAVEDVFKASETAEKIRARLGGDFKVVDWREANEPLFAALSLEKKFALAVISLIIFIAALNITATLALLVNERKFDIAILRTCGASSASLVLIFLFEGLFLGCIGIFAGVVLGLLACFAGNKFKVVGLSAEVYALDSIPFHPNFTDIAPVICIAFALCLIATVYPAFKASRVKPLENLRSQ